MGDVVLNKNELSVNFNKTTIARPKTKGFGFLRKLFNRKHRIESLENKVDFLYGQLNVFYQANADAKGVNAASLKDLKSEFEKQIR